MARRTAPPPETLTTEAAVNAFIASCRARNLAPKTLQAYLWALRPLKNASHALPSAPEPLENALAALPLSPESRHDVFRVWRTFFRWASARLGVPNPALELAPPRRRQLLPRALSDDQVDHLLATAAARTGPAARRDRALLLLLLDTGLRIGEVATLSRAHLGPATLVTGKTGMREIPVSPQVLAALVGLGDATTLWAGRKGPLTPSGVSQAVRRSLKRAGIPGGPHLLRHTFARLYITAGGDVFSLQRILGHRQIDTTKRYVDMDLRDVRAQHARFSPIARRPAAAQGRLLQ
ncbi:MAG: tyrosine-type recombinase/integrase [Dehalococcoidia bacterium]|nr:tyrosine-type recombinase/integrase [Dehalococcoidia bacterium]